MLAWTILSAVLGGMMLAALIANWYRIARWTPRQAALGLVAGLLTAPLSLIVWEAAAVHLRWLIELLLFEWHVPLIALTFAWLCAARLAPEAWLRRPLLVVGWGLLIWPMMVLWGPVLLRSDAIQLSRDGQMPWQTTWWSCGPAAMATRAGDYLNEHDAAAMCFTRPWLGTLPSGLAAGLRTASVSARILWFAEPDDLRQLRYPCLVYVRIYQRVIHIAELVSTDDMGVTLLDPCRGRITLTWTEFDAEWLGVAVVTD